MRTLPRNEIALKAIENSKLILLPSLSDCIDFSNLYAPEHLIINTTNADKVAEKVTNAGSVFLEITAAKAPVIMLQEQITLFPQMVLQEITAVYR